MTQQFKDIQSFYGTVRALRFEADVHDCEVVGEIPSALNGSLYRAGPDTFYPTLEGDVIVNGDGMVSAFRFEDGHVDFKCRYVRTERYLTERRARRRLYGKYRNPYTDDPITSGTDRDNTGNTYAFYHSGRLFALREDSWPYEIDPETLATKEKFNFDGLLESKALTAHPKIDPVTGEWWSFGLFAQKRYDGDMALQVIDRNGKLIRQASFQAPFAGIAHDFAVTREHVVFPVMPLTVDMKRVRAGGDFYAYDPNLPSAWGIMPRDGSPKDIRWFEMPGITIGHFMNAFSENGKVHIDATVSPGNNFPFFDLVGGGHAPQTFATMTRLTFDLESNSRVGAAAPFAGAVGEMPRFDERFAMSRYRYGFMKIREGIARIDWDSGKMDVHAISDSPGGAQEPIFVPRSPDSPEGDGYVICVVNRRPENIAELVILDSHNMAGEPVGTVRLPFNQPMAFHGCFVPR